MAIYLLKLMLAVISVLKPQCGCLHVGSLAIASRKILFAITDFGVPLHCI